MVWPRSAGCPFVAKHVAAPGWIQKWKGASRPPKRLRGKPVASHRRKPSPGHWPSSRVPSSGARTSSEAKDNPDAVTAGRDGWPGRERTSSSALDACDDETVNAATADLPAHCLHGGSGAAVPTAAWLRSFRHVGSPGWQCFLQPRLAPRSGDRQRLRRAGTFVHPVSLPIAQVSSGAVARLGK